MTDGGFPRSDLTAAAEAAGLVLARSLGLGDEVRIGEDWSFDDGDMVLASTLTGQSDGRFALGVNDAVGERLLADRSTLESAFANAVQAAGASLGVVLMASAVEAATSPAIDASSTIIIEITDAGVLTSLAAVTLPIAVPTPTIEFQPASFDDAIEPYEGHALAALSVLNDVDLVVTAELGRTTMAVRDLLGLSPGMVVEIDRAAGAPIDLLVNGRRIAAGEVVVIDEEFGIRITEIAPIGDRRR